MKIFILHAFNCITQNQETCDNQVMRTIGSCDKKNIMLIVFLI